MNNIDIVPDELKDLFIDIISMASTSQLRDWFEAMGIDTTEERMLTPAPTKVTADGSPIYMETKPVPQRVKHYFETVDWTDRKMVAKILWIVNLAARSLGEHHPSRIIQRANPILERHGLTFDGIRIRRIVENEADG
jgi:hypothetical protein